MASAANNAPRWKWVKGYRGLYKVSTEGVVKSAARVVEGKDGRLMAVTGRILKPGNLVSGSGKRYKVVSLWRGGKGRMFQVHRLVAMAFVPNPDNLPEVNHLDGNPGNNHYTNLEWTTRKGNIQHAIRTGLLDHSKRRMPKGEAHQNAKLTDNDVRTIRVLGAEPGRDTKAIASRFGVSRTQVNNILSNRVWKHVSL